MLHYILRMKPLVLILSLVLLVLSTWAAFSRGFTFMDMEMEADQISMTVGPREDQVLTFDELKALADETTAAISDVEGIETIGAMAGGGGTMSLMATGTESVTYYILLDPESDRSMYDIIDEIKEKTKDVDGLVDISTESSDMTALMGSGLSIQVQGRDLDKLEEIAQDVAKIVEETEGTIDVHDGLEDATSSLTIHVDKEKAAKYKMTVAQVFQLVYMEMASDTASMQISTDVKDYDVYVMSEEQSEVTLKDIKSITFPYTNEDGDEEDIKITEIATFEEGISMSSINRSAQTRYINVTAGIDEGHNVITESGSVQPLTVIRYGEVLLNKAEACYNLNKTTEANDAIKAIRTRVGLPYTAKGGSELWTAIRQERRVELAFEGHWYWDLRRWRVAHENYPEGLNNYQCHGLQIEDNGDGSFTYTYVSIDNENRKFNERMYRLPMPDGELENNSLVEQYKEWK